MIKLEILSAVADETNAYEIATELTEYVNDIDEPLARAAVRAVGRIALEVSSRPHKLSLQQRQFSFRACNTKDCRWTT